MSKRDACERITGANECIAALMKLLQSANSVGPDTDDAETFMATKSEDAKNLVDAFGPLTPRQEGAFRTLAEYIHHTETTGIPELKRWKPFIAQTPDEITAWVEETNRT